MLRLAIDNNRSDLFRDPILRLRYRQRTCQACTRLGVCSRCCVQFSGGGTDTDHPATGGLSRGLGFPVAVTALCQRPGVPVLRHGTESLRAAGNRCRLDEYRQQPGQSGGSQRIIFHRRVGDDRRQPMHGPLHGHSAGLCRRPTAGDCAVDLCRPGQRYGRPDVIAQPQHDPAFAHAQIGSLDGNLQTVPGLSPVRNGHMVAPRFLSGNR